MMEGSFRYCLNTYKDMLSMEKGNDEAYKIWRKSACRHAHGGLNGRHWNRDSAKSSINHMSRLLT